MYIAMIVFSALSAALNVAFAETFQGWQVMENSGNYSESEGVITLSGNEEFAGTTLYKNIFPQTDFEVSLQVKAETLGEVHKDPNGAGEGFLIMLRPNASLLGTVIGVNFELRARGGGQFLVNRHNSVADAYGWPYDWTPFVYNSLEYNDGSSFWRYSLPEVLEKAPVKPDIWYTMTLRVQRTPFIITAEVLTENGTLLGLFHIDDIKNFGFSDIGCIAISSGFGGTFYIRNLTMNGVASVEPTTITISAKPNVTLGLPLSIFGSLENNGVALSNELVMLKYSFAGADEWYPINSVYTDADGNYEAKWICAATGTFTLCAEWKGNRTYLPASANATVTCISIQRENVLFEHSDDAAPSKLSTANSDLNANISIWTCLFVVSVPLGLTVATLIYVKKHKLVDSGVVKRS